MSTLVECVPNFSEGRDKAKVDAIVDAMKMDGVYLLDREMDADHNRCVITLVGDREAIQEAAIRGVGKASELIDLTRHQGAHPRMGAADVVPFIPIEGVSIEDCVAMSRHVGEQIWKRYQIPVYLYEASATSPERQNLENIRRGQFEGIRDDIATNPARKPDYGDPRVHPTAGATVVGARKFLIAYNVFLNTTDVEIAKKIAKAVRFSSGGLRYVKGAGFLVRGLAQVSMNLTDFEQTPIHRVFEYVKREAARYGVSPVSSEIVGLIPKKALEQAAEWFLQVENFDSSLILENRLSAVMGGKMAVGGLRAGVEPFVEQLAAPTATPGGGSAAAASGAMAAALAHMVAAMSRGKKAYVQFEQPLSAAIARLSVLREELKASIDADAEAYNGVMKAYRQAKETGDADGVINPALRRRPAFH
jgi:glutamate formiminotransferase / formiminotetrahydrofolate cyclodeaminase